MSKWKIWPADKRCIRDSRGVIVATCPSGDVAKDIVREHNAFEPLLTALRGMVDDDTEAAHVTLDDGPGGTVEEQAADSLIFERRIAARDAIKLAEGNP